MAQAAHSRGAGGTQEPRDPGTAAGSLYSGSTSESFCANSPEGPHPFLYLPSIASCFPSLSPGYKLHMMSETGTVISRWAAGHKPLTMVMGCWARMSPKTPV